MPLLLTAPALEPVTVAEAKAAARLDGSHWDAIVADAIKAARVVAEHQTGQHVMQQTWRTELPEWPAADELLPYLRPTTVVVQYWSTSSTWVTLSSGAYVVAPADPGIVLVPALNTSWPVLGDVAAGPRVRVDVTLGATDPAAAHPACRQFIKALVGLMVADPTLTAMDALASSAYLPRMLDPARLYR